MNRLQHTQDKEEHDRFKTIFDYLPERVKDNVRFQLTHIAAECKIDTTDNVRNAEVDEDIKETRFQGLKNRLAIRNDAVKIMSLYKAQKKVPL